VARGNKAGAVGDTVADDISGDLIAAINKEFGTRVAYNLNHDEAPTTVKRWLSTGSILLDYIIANRRNGGFPEGRIIEIYGPPSTGKSHIAFQVARTVQQLNGLVVYIDTENATPVEKLHEMGIDIGRRFVYCDTHCTEEVFAIIESTITKAKSVISKDVPILVVWDSVAATSPKAELEGDYDTSTVGLQARTISKALRKITGVIGHNNVTLLCLNQIRSKIGVSYGDPTTTPGGMAIPFHASVRLRLGQGAGIKNAAGDTIGIHISVDTKKNKVAPPMRKVEFDIHFGTGIVENDSIFDLLRVACEKNKGPIEFNGKKHLVEGTSAWKLLKVTDMNDVVIVEKKFTKSQTMELVRSELYGPHLLDMIEAVMVHNKSSAVPADEGDASDAA
jgi:recombination protein RecA